MIPDLPGAVTAVGTLERQAGDWTSALRLDAPGNSRADLAGTFDETTGRVDATMQGDVQLAALNLLVSPVSVRGRAQFDLALRGQPSLAALSGRISTTDSSVAVPMLRNTIRNLSGSVDLADGRARIAATGGLRTGGALSVAGPVSLTAPYVAALDIGMVDIGLTDAESFKSSANGRLRFDGPLTGNGRLGGGIDIGETEIDIAAASGGLSSAPIPPITHIGDTAGVRATRARAGLVETSAADGSAGPAIDLDIRLSAPQRVFVRGRGLDAELGGEIFIRGTTASIAPAGRIELIRGNLDIFGRRLVLDRGSITLQGSLTPFLDFATSANTQDGSATLEIRGVPPDLEVSVTSDPDRPQEEALAMLIFGDRFTELSPLKIARLAGSLVRLRGGGDGAAARARRLTGADMIGLAEDETGTPALELGGYASENVYTDLSINTRGDTELNINLGVSENVTLKGTLDNSGNSALGLFFTRDY